MVWRVLSLHPPQLSSAQPKCPTHGIDQLNKILVAFGIKLIKACGIRGSPQEGRDRGARNENASALHYDKA